MLLSENLAEDNPEVNKDPFYVTLHHKHSLQVFINNKTKLTFSFFFRKNDKAVSFPALKNDRL